MFNLNVLLLMKVSNVDYFQLVVWVWVLFDPKVEIKSTLVKYYKIVYTHEMKIPSQKKSWKEQFSFTQSGSLHGDGHFEITWQTKY